ncbi:hypothetical protein JCM10908_001467 [Rhodotorula pacifica]|uniref:2,5-diamino-6-(ribosylamino)-4(3H)-pyrimidinone 5'-phosphate reductase n=1 Tax=Rhodotorula pacifica TaxID=1495444 RepID=UPI00317221AC
MATLPGSAAALELDHDTADLDSFLRKIYPSNLFDPPTDSTPAGNATSEETRPFVTLTWAQSLDGKIAGPNKSQVTLSGNESMRFTHRLRELHDSILVGVGTVLNDDPSLTARLPTLLPLESQPTPIILDPSLRTPLSAKLLENARNGVGKVPVVCTNLGEEEIAASGLGGGGRSEVRVVRVASEKDSSRISLPSLLDPSISPPFVQKALGRSLMIEGGASVLASFLSAGDPKGRALVDRVVVTVAPVLIGPEGVEIPFRPQGVEIPFLGSSSAKGTTESPLLPRLEPIATKVLGNDTVFVCKPVWD